MLEALAESQMEVSSKTHNYRRNSKMDNLRYNFHEAFELNSYIMKLLWGAPPSYSSERIFNYRLSRAQHVIENTFGVMCLVFRVLRKPILLKPKEANKIVLTMAYLHFFFFV
ncbi:hypothetical protein PR048_028535 [Dryococelus australis]|uniref:DDE Tnp4 domain-containing protein n=1 Tax=Dryococelus australis TaxID=614101 RepID=A0ABQ9GAV2_9NEOP|nr:hypothetical protein PR048_028535 [Dryococelus australis]